MISPYNLEEVVRQVVASMGTQQCNSKQDNYDCGNISIDDYPLGEKRTDLLRTPRGISYDDITLENVINGKIKAEDLRISSETLKIQAVIAERAGRKFFAENLYKAAELTRIPDDRIIEIYNSLRPHRSTKTELLNIAAELEDDYQAKRCANYVREAAEVYEIRHLLKTAED